SGRLLHGLRIHTPPATLEETCTTLRIEQVMLAARAISEERAAEIVQRCGQINVRVFHTGMTIRQLTAETGAPVLTLVNGRGCRGGSGIERSRQLRIQPEHVGHEPLFRVHPGRMLAATFDESSPQWLVLEQPLESGDEAGSVIGGNGDAALTNLVSGFTLHDVAEEIDDAAGGGAHDRL